MSDERIRLVLSVFRDVCELPPDERAAVLETSCGGDRELLAEVESMLAWDASNDGPPPSDPEEMPETIGGYRVVRLIAHGGMGVVYEARQEKPERRVALKLACPGGATPERRKRFELEVQLLGRLHHPDIAQIIDAGTTGAAEGSRPYFVMEYVDGRPLTDYANEQLGTVRERLALMVRVCAAVGFAHGKGVVHRDLKPDNVLVEADGAPKVLDFGVAKVEEAGGFGAATLRTEAGRVLGTMGYIAPEQLGGRTAGLGPAADVYSLGVMIYELLTDRRPHEFDGATLAHALAVVTTTDAPPLGVVRPEYRGDIEAIVGKALEKDARHRYPDATALQRDLERYLNGEPILARPAGPLRRLSKWTRRKPALATTVFCLFVAVSSVAGVLLQKNREVRAALAAASTEARNARAARAEATRRAEELGRQKTRFQRRTEEFEMLALIERLRMVRAREEGLYPAWPEKIAAMRAWLAEDGEDVGRLRGGLPRARATLAALRSRSPATDAERAASRRVHERYGELRTLRSKLAWQRQAQAVRAGAAPPRFDPEPGVAAKSVEELNSLAWPLIDPARHEFGREAEGLALARLGRGKAIGRWVASVGDTLAWALFANGLDDEALEESRKALEAAHRSDRAKFRLYLDRLERAVATARSEAGASALARLEREVSDLEAELTDWRLPVESDRFLHNALTGLVRDCESFLETTVKDVAQRLRWAERVEELTIRRFRTRWEEARDAIRKADGVVANRLYREPPIDLEPQMGLIPIGMNPVTGLWEFYHLRSAWDRDAGIDPAQLAIPTLSEDGSIEVADDTGMVFVLLPGGTFTMGAQARDPNGKNHDPLAGPDETLHRETVDPFFLARHEVTKGQWKRLSGGKEPSFFRVGIKYQGFPETVNYTYPVELVSWKDCYEFAKRHKLRLPYEAQWEYACRAGTTTRWSTGSEPGSLAGFANLGSQVRGRTGSERVDLKDRYVGPAPVGRFLANPWGLFDMHGNLWEWCEEPYEAFSTHVIRGGCYDESAYAARSSARTTAGGPGHNVGVRLARARF